jgi:hypothetical protein
MQIKQRSGGESVGIYFYKLEAPNTPRTQVAMPLQPRYPKGAVVAVALKGVKLRDGATVVTTFELGPFSCGRILGETKEAIGSELTEPM